MDFKINKANPVRLKESPWASSPQPLKVPWLWWEWGVRRRCGGRTRGWAAVGACGYCEGPTCQQQLASRSPTRLSSCVQQVGSWAGTRRGQWLHCCVTAGRSAGAWEGDLRHEALVCLAIPHCDTAGLYLHKKAPRIVVFLWKNFYWLEMRALHE